MGTTKDYDTTVARIAGNLLSGMTRIDPEHDGRAVTWAVGVARQIVEQTKRTEPKPPVGVHFDKPPTGIIKCWSPTLSGLCAQCGLPDVTHDKHGYCQVIEATVRT